MRVIATILFDGLNSVNSKRFREMNPSGNLKTCINLYQLWEVDEILILCVRQSDYQSALNILKDIDVNTPISLGGGIKTYQDAVRVIQSGVERITLGSNIPERVETIRSFASNFGEEAVLPIIDCNFTTGLTALNYSINSILDQFQGWAGEIFLQNIENDGFCKNPEESFDDMQNLCDRYSDLNLIISGSIHRIDFERFSSTKNVSAVALDRIMETQEGAYPLFFEKVRRLSYECK